MITKKMITSIVSAVILIGVCIAAALLLKSDNEYYYTKIDNSNVKINTSRNGVIDFDGGMSYLYTLESFNEKGSGKKIKFGASKELREGAYLRLTAAPLRGVIEWEEIQYNELPQAVQSKIG